MNAQSNPYGATSEQMPTTEERQQLSKIINSRQVTRPGQAILIRNLPGLKAIVVTSTVRTFTIWKQLPATGIKDSCAMLQLYKGKKITALTESVLVSAFKAAGI